MSETPEFLLSIVVIGRNEGERLIRCLESIRSMTKPNGNVEVIYVDSASTDGSLNQAVRMGVKTLELKPHECSAAAARNVGWQSSKGEYILFLDGDTAIDAHFVNVALPHFRDLQLAVVFGNLREYNPSASFYNRVIDIDWIYNPGYVKYPGGNSLIRRRVLEEVGGFDPLLKAGEEPEIGWRIRSANYKILQIDKLMGLHDLHMKTFKDYWNRAYRSGYAYAEIADRFSQTHDQLWFKESKHNLIKGGIIIIGFFAIFVLSYSLASLYPLLIGFGIALFFVLRTTIKTYKKSKNLITSLLHGIHSHFMQIPIFLGQMAYWRKRSRQT